MAVFKDEAKKAGVLLEAPGSDVPSFRASFETTVAAWMKSLIVRTEVVGRGKGDPSRHVTLLREWQVHVSQSIGLSGMKREI